MLKTLFRKFVADEGGFLNSAELAFLGTLLVIGIVPGIVTLRDAIVTEFADMAEAVNPGPPGHANGPPPHANPGPPGHANGPPSHANPVFNRVDELPVGERPTVAADIFP